MDEGLLGEGGVQAQQSLRLDSVSPRLAEACEAFGITVNSAQAKKTDNANWQRIHTAYSRIGAHALAANPDWRTPTKQASAGGVILGNNTRTATNSVPFKFLVLLWILLCGVLGGYAIWLMERKNPAFAPAHAHRPYSRYPDMRLLWDCFFVSMNGITASGLATLDLTRMSGGSQIVLLLTMQLGSAVMLTLMPIFIHMYSLRAMLLRAKLPFDPFEITRYRARVPKWLVEYKAMSLLAWIVLLYQLAIHLLCGGCLYLMIVNDDEVRQKIAKLGGPRGCSVVWFCVFMTVSFFTNTGFAVVSSCTIFARKPMFLFFFAIATMAGNTMFPVRTQRTMFCMFMRYGLLLIVFICVSLPGLAALVHRVRLLALEKVFAPQGLPALSAPERPHVLSKSVLFTADVALASLASQSCLGTGVHTVLVLQIPQGAH